MKDESVKNTRRQVNANGNLIGESHPGAVLTDHEVELIRKMHEQDRMGYRRIAAALGVSRHTVRDICRYTRRAQCTGV